MAMNFWILDGKTPVMASEDEWATMSVTAIATGSR